MFFGLSSLFLICFFITITIIYLLFILPLYRIQKIKNDVNDCKNVMTYFFPLIGFYRYVIFPDKFDDHIGMRNIVKENNNLKVYITNFATQSYLVLNDTNLIREFLIEKSHLYRKFTLLVFSDFLFGQELTEEKLKQRREIFAPVFHFENLKQKIPMIQKTAIEMVQRLNNSIQQKSSISIISQMQETTGDLLVRAFFGEKFVKNKLNNLPISLEVADILKECAEITKSNPIAIIRNLVIGIKTEKTPQILFSQREKKLIVRMDKLKQLMKDEMLKRLEEFHQNKIQDEDFLYIYIKAYFEAQQKYKQKQSNQKKFVLDFDFIMQQFMTIFVAGMDTTAHSTAMCLYLLSKNSQCQQKLVDEIKNMQIIKQDGQLDFENLKQANYLNGCVNECLRLYTPAPTLIPRYAIKDHKIGNIHIKKGCFVDGMILGCMNNPKFFPQPEIFDPQRWIDKNQPFKDDIFSYIPFNAGPRNCLGQYLALLEIKIYVVYAVLNFEMQQNKNTPLQMISKPLYGPKNDDIIIFQSRKI